MIETLLLRAFRFVQLMERPVRPTAEEIARELGICERHAKRYIAAANAVHLPMPPSVDQLEEA